MILDGGLGLELERRGFAYSTRLWSGEALLRDPDVLRAIHVAYLEAGAQIIETATYQLSLATLRELGYAGAAAAAVFASAVVLAREAIAQVRRAGTDAGAPAQLVAGSLGPYGATLGDGSEYSASQHLDEPALYAFHAERTAALVRARPDFVLFETIPTRTEALVVAAVARDLGLHGVWLCLACADGTSTYGGDEVQRLAAELDAFDTIGVLGVNCTPPGSVAPLIRSMRSVTNKPLVVYPNLGQHWESATHGLTRGATDAEFLACVPEWLALNVTHIGGCCGVGPETIAALAQLVRRSPPAARAEEN